MKQIKDNFWFAYIFILNLLDAILTHYSVSRKLTEEVNPLMKYLLEIHPAAFYLCKLTLVSLGLVLLKKLGETRGTKIALTICSSVYTAVVIIHVFILT
jgi:hypothetical protein|tara:strand:+ start:493 stop:789 length:297 start_codon:yes stop_codon:yes gene_type:complete